MPPAPGQVERLARAAARRRLASRLVSAGGIALVAGSAAALVVASGAKLAFAPESWRLHWPWYAGGTFVTCALVGALLALRSRWSEHRAAVELDARLGLKDRLSNAMALASHRDDPFAALAVAEGQAAASRVQPSDLQRAVPVKWGDTWSIWPLLAVAALGVGMFAPAMKTPSPNAADTLAVRPHAVEEVRSDVKSAALKARQTIDAVAPDLASNPQLRAVDELEKELAGEDSSREAITEKAARAADALDSAARELERRAENARLESDELREKLAAASERSPRAGSPSGEPGENVPGEKSDVELAADELLEAMKEGDLPRAAEAASDLRESAEGTSVEDRRAAAERLREYADLLDEQQRSDPTPAAPGSPGAPGSQDAASQTHRADPANPPTPGTPQDAPNTKASPDAPTPPNESPDRSTAPPAKPPEHPADAPPNDEKRPQEQGEPKQGDQRGERTQDQGAKQDERTTAPEGSTQDANQKQGTPSEEPSESQGEDRQDPRRKAGDETRRLADNLRRAADELSENQRPQDRTGQPRPGESPKSATDPRSGAPPTDRPSASDAAQQDPTRPEGSEHKQGEGEPPQAPPTPPGAPAAPATDANKGEPGARPPGQPSTQPGQPRTSEAPPRPATEPGSQPKGEPSARPSQQPQETTGPRNGEQQAPGQASDRQQPGGPPPQGQPGGQPKGGEESRPGTPHQPDAGAQPNQGAQPKGGEQPQSGDQQPGASSQPGARPDGAKPPNAGSPPPGTQPGAEPRGGSQESPEPGGSGESPQGTPPATDQLEQQLRRLANRAPSAARDEKAARELRKRAEDLYNAASPEEKKRLEELAKEFGNRGDPHGSPPRPPAGAGSGEGSARQGTLPEWTGPTQSVDATRPRPGSSPQPSGREQVLSEMESADPADPSDRTVGRRVIEERVHEAAAGAQRALEQDTVPRRHRDLVRRVFQRYLPARSDDEQPRR